MTSSGSAEHDRHLEKHVNCSVMVRYCSFQTGNEMRCDWCVALLDICFHIGVQQESMGCRKTCKVDKLLRQSQRDMVCGQRQRLPTAKKSNQIRGTDKVSPVVCKDFSQRECARRISGCSPEHCRTLHVWHSVIAFWHFRMHFAKCFDFWWWGGWTLLGPKVGWVLYHSCHQKSIKLPVG